MRDTRRRAAAGLLAAAALTVTGCAARASDVPPIQLASAYVPVPRVPGVTVAYVVIQNNGRADRLVSARTSAGGRVTFQVSGASGVTRVERAVPVPAHGTLAMAPDRVHMVLTGVSRLTGGHDITLTLVFAHAGQVPVQTEVTDPASGGSYVLN